jgi:hypothetical protein
VQIVDGLEEGQHVVMHADEQMLAKLPTVNTAVTQHNLTALAHPKSDPQTTHAGQAEPQPNVNEVIVRPKPAGGGELAKDNGGD